LPKHLDPVRLAFVALASLPEGIRPEDIRAHLDLIDETDPAERRRIYLGVMACEQERRAIQAERGRMEPHGDS
jgi:hypothetical protein